MTSDAACERTGCRHPYKAHATGHCRVPPCQCAAYTQVPVTAAAGDAGRGLRDEVARAITSGMRGKRWVDCTPKDFADALLPLIERVQAEARRDALLEAADAWQVNGWADVLLPRPSAPAIPVIADAQAVTDWLRERAGDAL